jgi:hypothetical protein
MGVTALCYGRERKDSCVLTAVSLSIRRKKQTVLWVSAGLPADAFGLLAVPGKAAALLLYCQQVCFKGFGHIGLLPRSAGTFGMCLTFTTIRG